jgi:CRP-like cAMP-binding protein
MKEGDVIVSIESFFEQKESYESIQALEDCTLYYIEYTELQNIYRQFPEFNFIGRVLTEKYYKLWAQQLHGLRMQPAADRYKWLLQNHPELILRVHAKYLASWLGITEVMLSKIKARK